jgi:putative ABC transport system permease protein
VTLTASASSQVSQDSSNWATSVTGSNIAYFYTKIRQIVQGRVFTKGELKESKTICLLTYTFQVALFGETDPLGRSMRLGKIAFNFVDTLQTKRQYSLGTDQDEHRRHSLAQPAAPHGQQQQRVSG